MTTSSPWDGAEEIPQRHVQRSLFQRMALLLFRESLEASCTRPAREDEWLRQAAAFPRVRRKNRLHLAAAVRSTAKPSGCSVGEGEFDAAAHGVDSFGADTDAIA